jgi:hypothetical protein
VAVLVVITVGRVDTEGLRGEEEEEEDKQEEEDK